MTARQTLSRTFALLRARWQPLVALVILSYGPLYVAQNGLLAVGALPAEALDRFFGLLAVFVGPLVSGASVYLVAQGAAGEPSDLGQALAVGFRALPRLLAAYLAMSFVLLGWLAVCLIPGGLLMLVFKLKSPVVLIPFAAVAALRALPQYAFIDPLVVLEGQQAWRARQQSVLLTRGRRRRIVGLGLLAAVGPGVAELLASELPGAVDGLFPGAAFLCGTTCGLASSLLSLIPAALLYVLYYEAKAAPVTFEETPHVESPS